MNFVVNFVGFRPFSTKFATKISRNTLLGQALISVRGVQAVFPPANDERRERSVLDKPVANTSDGVEVSGCAPQFFPQAAHVSVHRAGVDEIVILPDILQESFA